jgi:rRNA maturation endonuclease Nob1
MTTKHRLQCENCDAEYLVIHALDEYYEPSQCPFCGSEANEIELKEEDE